MGGQGGSTVPYSYIALLGSESQEQRPVRPLLGRPGWAEWVEMSKCQEVPERLRDSSVSVPFPGPFSQQQLSEEAVREGRTHTGCMEWFL